MTILAHTISAKVEKILSLPASIQNISIIVGSLAFNPSNVVRGDVFGPVALVPGIVGIDAPIPGETGTEVVGLGSAGLTAGLVAVRVHTEPPKPPVFWIAVSLSLDSMFRTRVPLLVVPPFGTSDQFRLIVFPSIVPVATFENAGFGEDCSPYHQMVSPSCRM